MPSRYMPKWFNQIFVRVSHVKASSPSIQTAKVHLDQRTLVWLQGMRSSRLAACFHQRMVLDRWIAEARRYHRSSPERLVWERWHRSPPARQPWIATGWIQRELLGHPQQLLQRRNSLGESVHTVLSTISNPNLCISSTNQFQYLQHDVGE